MRARCLGLLAVLTFLPALAGALSGCGEGTVEANVASGGELAIYSSLPLQGPDAATSQQIVNGEKLALADAGGRAGRFRIGYVSLDDATPAKEQWDPGVTATNAKTAAQDTSTIAYIGDYNSAATAISLPLINGAGILQVSPGSPYVGLTSSLDAGQDEPERFYPTGKRTFVRLQPGDPAQAQAQIRLMGELGVRSVYILDDQDPFEGPLASLVAGDAQVAGIKVVAHDSIATPAGATFKGEVEKITESHPQAVFFAGGSGPGVVTLWRELHEAAPTVLLLGTSTTVSEAFTSQIGAAEAKTYLTTPVLNLGSYPPSARRVLNAYRRQFGEEATAYALYGFEAMNAVLAAIRKAGRHGNVRQEVTRRFFPIHNRESVLGRYSVEPDGETTASLYGVDRVVGGHAVFYTAISTR